MTWRRRGHGTFAPLGPVARLRVSRSVRAILLPFYHHLCDGFQGMRCTCAVRGCWYMVRHEDSGGGSSQGSEDGSDRDDDTLDDLGAFGVFG